MRYPDRLERLDRLDRTGGRAPSRALRSVGVAGSLSKRAPSGTAFAAARRHRLVGRRLHACIHWLRWATTRAVIAPSTRWPAGIWRGNRGVAAIRTSCADTLCSSHGRRRKQRCCRYQHGGVIYTSLTPSIRDFWWCAIPLDPGRPSPLGPGFWFRVHSRASTRLTASLRLDLAACVLRLGFCERFLGSTRQRYLINA